MKAKESKLSPFPRGPAPYLLCLVASIALFSVALYTDDILNDDGINYIYAAYETINGSPETAIVYRQESAFTKQFVVLSKYTGLSLLESAYALSLIAQIALMCGFLAVVRSLGASARIQLLAILVFASTMYFNDLRPNILRGFEFWSAQIWALWALIKFAHTSRWRYLLYWLALSSLAIFFRIEGLIYLAGIAILAPFALSGLARKRALGCSALILAVIVTIGALNQQILTKTTGTLSGPYERLNQEFNTARKAGHLLDTQKELIRANMPNKWARNSSSDFFIGGLLFMVAMKLLYTNNGILLVLAFCFGRIREIPKNKGHPIIVSYFLVGLTIALYTIASRFFITGRYVFLPSLLLCVPIPFLLNQILFNSEARSWSYRYILRGTILALSAAMIIVPALTANNNKMYIREAANWVSDNLPPTDNIYFNDMRVAFYSDDFANQSFLIEDISIEDLRLSGYRYAVVHEISGKATNIIGPTIQSGKVELINSVIGSKNARVDTYKILHPDE